VPGGGLGGVLGSLRGFGRMPGGFGVPWYVLIGFLISWFLGEVGFGGPRQGFGVPRVGLGCLGRVLGEFWGP